MTKRACRICRKIYEGNKCLECGSQDYVDEWKGRVIIFDAENSEIAKNIKVKNKGSYAIKVK